MKYPETAKRLSYILNLRKMTAQELSNKSGVGKSSISQYINGSHEPKNINAGAMAKVLKCDPMWLMGFDVPMEKNDFMQKLMSGEIKKDNMQNHAFVFAIDKLTRDMTPEQMKNILDYAEFLKGKDEKKEGEENVMDRTITIRRI